MQLQICVTISLLSGPVPPFKCSHVRYVLVLCVCIHTCVCVCVCGAGYISNPAAL